MEQGIKLCKAITLTTNDHYHPCESVELLAGTPNITNNLICGVSHLKLEESEENHSKFRYL